jgi:hypothetical protein
MTFFLASIDHLMDFLLVRWIKVVHIATNVYWLPD